MAEHGFVSVVIPVFNEQEVLAALFQRLDALEAAAKGQERSFTYDFIFVNDGSSDHSRELLDAYVQGSAHKAIHFSRNFGHQAAVSAGLRFAKGDFVAIIDGDLQDPPEAIPEMVNHLIKAHADVVYGVRTDRKEGKRMRASYFLFYRILQLLSPINIPLDSGDFSVISARVAKTINRMPERHRFVRGLRSYSGFRQVPFAYVREKRYAGEPKYTFRKLLGLAADGIFTFSEEPLRFSTYIGLGVSAISIVTGIIIFIWRLLAGNVLPGFATLAIGLFLLSGIQLLSLGILGEYIGRVHNEVKRRPSYVIDTITRGRS